MKYRIGLIGCGGIAGTWINAVGQHENCAISHTYDLATEAAEKRAAEVGARAVAEVDEIFAADEIDLVIIGTPTPSHPDLVVRAARAGKHIMCEKPMALSLGLCQDMIDAVAAAGVKLAIGHSLRFWGAFLTCRRLVAEGVIGTPVSGSVDRMGTAGVQRVQTEGGSGHWRDDVRNTGGTVLEGFIHELDFARAVFGQVQSVFCELSGGRDYGSFRSPHLVQALVTFTSGALVTARTGSTVALPTRGYWIGGTEGGLRFTEWGGPVQVFKPDAEVEEVAADTAMAYYLELCDLLEAVERGGEPENSPLNGKENIALGLGMYRSFESGQRVDYAAGLPVDMAEDYRNTQW